MGCFGWCCFQYCVAVVCASSCVPGVGVCVSWLVLGACLGVGWLVPGVSGACVGWLASVGVVGASVGVSWLVCVLWWFRMLTCSGLFLVFLVLFLIVCLVNNGLSWVWAGFGAGWWLARVFLACSGVFLFCLVGVCPVLVGAGRGRGVFSVGYWVVVPCCLCLRAVNGVRAGVCAWWCVRGRVWWVWLFGCGVCCSGWRVAFLVG